MNTLISALSAQITGCVAGEGKNGGDAPYSAAAVHPLHARVDALAGVLTVEVHAVSAIGVLAARRLDLLTKDTNTLAE